MNAIIQHTFNSGLGDCIVAVNEYITHATKLKQLGYLVHLKINVTQNKYYDNLNLFDLFDSKEFDVFDTIQYIEASVKEFLNYKVKYISYISTPGLHWWDLFLDTDADITVDVYSQVGAGFSKLPEKGVRFNQEVYDIVEGLNYKNFESVYIRTLDANENTSLYDIHVSTIDEIHRNAVNVFTCSNSYQIKRLLSTYKNSLSVEIPYETYIGNHYHAHCNHKIDYDMAKKRTLLTLVEMTLLANSQYIYLITEWNRVSNFLFGAYVNKVPVKFL